MLGATVSATAEPASGGLEGSPGLGGSEGLHSGRVGLRGGERLGRLRLQPSARQPTPRLQVARTQSAGCPVSRATLKNAAAEIARQGLSEVSLQGAATSIPRSQIGVLLFDVGGELERMEADMDEEAVGYYMAALADPQGERYDEAKRRLHEIFLEGGLSHEEAVRLYAGGWSTFAELSEPRIGLTREGLASARRDLRELKSTYHQRRAVMDDEGSPETHAGQDAADPGID